MAKAKPMPGKRRTREHVIADLSVNHVERYVLRCGFTVERRWHDYGFDLGLTTYDANGELEIGEVLMQMKATDHLKVTSDGLIVRFRVERVDLRRWLAVTLPVIFVVYNARADEAYWLYLQAHFARQHEFDPLHGSQTVTLRIPRTQRFEEVAVRQIAHYRDKIQSQIGGVLHHDR